MIGCIQLPGTSLHTLKDAGVYQVAFSADGCTLASGTMQKTIKLWDVTPFQQQVEDAIVRFTTYSLFH